MKGNREIDLSKMARILTDKKNEREIGLKNEFRYAMCMPQFHRCKLCIIKILKKVSHLAQDEVDSQHIQLKI